MPNCVRVIHLSDGQRQELERRATSWDLTQRQIERAHIVLLAASGMPGRAIARRVGCSEPTVILWRRRFAETGLAGLKERRGARMPAPSPLSGHDSE
jgi:transposase